MVSPNSVSTAANLPSSCMRDIIYVGGYWFKFYQRTSDNYLCYRSSQDGANWGIEQAIVAANGNGSISIFTDGTNILIAYYIGTDSTSSNTATTGYTRIGTQSAGVITFNDPVSIRQAGGYWIFTIAKTTNYWYVAIVAYYTSTKAYHVHVYYSLTASSWTETLDSTTLTDSSNRSGLAITNWAFQYTDGIVLVAAKANTTTFLYKTYTGPSGNSWSADTTFGTKTSGTNIYSNLMSLATYNNQVHFVCVPYGTGGTLAYYYFITSWSSVVNIDASTCLCPVLAAYSQYLYVFYIISTTIYWRRMVYSSNSWDSSATTYVSGESSPTILNCEQYPTVDSFGVNWASGASVRFILFSYATYTITGVTRDSSGNSKAYCDVQLFRTSDNVLFNKTISGINGNYSFTVYDNTTQYFATSFKAAAVIDRARVGVSQIDSNLPDIQGCSDNNLQGT